jgi:glycerophosphoinositol glycerophosphodiesterase
MSWRPAYMSQKVYDSCDESKGVPRSDSAFDQLRQTAMDWIHDWAFFNLYYYILGLSAVLLHKDVITP